MARPKKYKEKLMNLSIALEPSLIEKLKIEAQEKALSLNEYITGLIAASNPALATTLVQEYKGLQSTLREYSKRLQESNLQIQKLQRKSIYGYLFEEIEDLPEINQYIEQVKSRVFQHKEEIEKYKMGFSKPGEEAPIPFNIFIENLTDFVFNQFEMDLLKKGQKIKDKSAIKTIIKSKLLRL